ncbi:MAG TPA: DUF2188 domain-containing protein [Planctomycetota bacterium]|nr:DUF2188 domain-containing protein [Planctomycetota bacterium]
MTHNHSLYVAHAGDKGWEIRHGRGGKVLDHFSTRAEAEAAARKAVAGLGGGEVCVEVPDGPASKAGPAKG